MDGDESPSNNKRANDEDDVRVIVPFSSVLGIWERRHINGRGSNCVDNEG